MPTPANEYRIRPEQSKPTVSDPEPMPRLGPAALPPPHEYGTPSCESPRRMTYSEACRPYTRGIRPLVIPVSSGLRMPSFCRKPRPMLAVTCDEVAEIPRTVLMIAIGSPGTLALGTIGKVGSHSPAHCLRSLPRRAAPGAPVSHRSPERAPAGAPPADADQLRAASSLAWAALRSAARRLASDCCSLNLRWASVSAATAASWLDCASAAARSAFCLASRAADSLFTCSVRARCRFTITCRELAVRVRLAVAVAMMSSGLAAVR